MPIPAAGGHTTEEDTVPVALGWRKDYTRFAGAAGWVVLGIGFVVPESELVGTAFAAVAAVAAVAAGWAVLGIGLVVPESELVDMASAVVVAG